MPGASLITALRRIRGYLASATGLRRVQRSVNGVLTGFLCAVSGAVAAVCGEGAGYG